LSPAQYISPIQFRSSTTEAAILSAPTGTTLASSQAPGKRSWYGVGSPNPLQRTRPLAPTLSPAFRPSACPNQMPQLPSYEQKADLRISEPGGPFSSDIDHHFDPLCRSHRTIPRNQPASPNRPTSICLVSDVNGLHAIHPPRAPQFEAPTPYQKMLINCTVGLLMMDLTNDPLFSRPNELIANGQPAESVRNGQDTQVNGRYIGRMGKAVAECGITRGQEVRCTQLLPG
jgi:hypothetical protein